MKIPTPPVRCPIEGHDRGWWAWGPWLAAILLSTLAVIASIIPWQIAGVIIVLACIAIGVSYFHIACHFAPHSKIAGGPDNKRKEKK